MGRRLCSAKTVWLLLFLTLMIVVVLHMIDKESTRIIIFCGCVVALWSWFSQDLDDETTREFQNTESSNNSDTRNSLPVSRTRIVIGRVRARRERLHDGQQFSFASREHAARLSMKALPPVKCFRADDQADAESSQRDCPICLEDFKNGELIQPFGLCVHQFHFSCLNSWLLGGNTSCPICRKDLSSTVD